MKTFSSQSWLHLKRIDAEEKIDRNYHFEQIVPCPIFEKTGRNFCTYGYVIYALP